MAKAKTSRKKVAGVDKPVNDRTIFFSDLSYMQPELKNETWAAQVLYYAKKYHRRFVDPDRYHKYTKFDLLELDEKIYKQMFDPITPEGGGGEAKYISSDMKANPIYIHLINNMRSEIQRTGKQIEVNFTDKYAKTRKMRDSYKALYSRQVRSIINEFCKELGIRPMSESQDPYKWIKNFSKQQDSGEGDKEMGNDIVGKFADLIKNKIENNEDLMLYNEMVYKGDYEQAIEKGIKFFMFEQNKFDERHADDVFDHIRHFNADAMEWYTDRITGRPVISKWPVHELRISPFREKDGSDIQYYFIEYEVTFADFVKTCGYGLKPEKLKEVFEWNKMQGSRHGIDWRDEFWGGRVSLRDNAYIRLGRCGILSQDYEVDMDKVMSKFPDYNRDNMTWSKDPDNEYEIDRSMKNFNVWRTFYYIPPTQNELGNADYAWQARFIFDIHVNQDQFRYGEDGRYSMCPLVVYNNPGQASTTDIMESYMPKINFAWQQYQNCLLNDVDATVLSNEFMGGLLAAVDEENANNPGEGDQATGGNERAAAAEQWKMIRQAGKGFIAMVDKQGKPIVDPNKLILVYKNGFIERADKFLGQIVNLYQQLNTAIGNDPNATKPRVNAKGIQEAVTGSENARWFMQKGYESIIKSLAERFVRYILMAGQEAKELGYQDRYQEFKDVLGMTDGLLIEGLEDIAPESIGLNVSYVNNDGKKDFVMKLAENLVAQGKLDEDILYLLLGMDNWKEGFCLMRMSITKKKKEAAAQAELAHQQAMEAKEMDLKIAQALTAAKGEAKDKNIMTQGNVQAMLDQQMDKLKAATMAQQKDQISTNKQKENAQKAQLQRQNETADALQPQES